MQDHHLPGRQKIPCNARPDHTLGQKRPKLPWLPPAAKSTTEQRVKFVPKKGHSESCGGLNAAAVFLRLLRRAVAAAVGAAAVGGASNGAAAVGVVVVGMAVAATGVVVAATGVAVGMAVVGVAGNL